MKQLNPGYKFLTILIATLLLSLTYRTLVNTVVFAVTVSIVLLTPGVNRKRMFFAFLPVLLTAAGLFMSGLLFPAEGAGEITVSVFGQTTLYATSLNSALLLATRVLAFAGIGMMFALTTDAEEFIISLMQQFRLPPKFAYGILAAYHFFPVVISEYEIVRQALLMRGVKAGPFSRKRMFPMLVHALERSESLAMAMESRGFDGNAPRSTAHKIPLRTIDFIFLVGVNGALLLAIFLL